MAEAQSAGDDRRWAGRTAEERASLRRRQLLDAAFDLLGTEGAGAVTVRAVTRDSGLSPRYFYESFADREELLRAVFDDQFARLRDQVERAMLDASPDFDAQARSAIDATARCLEQDPRIARAMMRETLADDTLRRHAEQRLPEFVIGVAVRSVAHQAGGATDFAEQHVHITAISGVVVALFLSWSEGSLAVTRDELVTHTLGIIAAIVGTALSA